MSIYWVSPEEGVIISQIEGTEIQPIKLMVEGSTNFSIEKISGDLPNGIHIIKNDDGYFIQGEVENISDNIEYSFTLQAKDNDSKEFAERYFIIKLFAKPTTWDENNKTSFDVLEKDYFKYQFNLIEPTGREKFFIESGEIPSGLKLSSNGSLYGITPKYYDYKDMYIFTMCVELDDNIIIRQPITFNIKSLSSINEPIWVTNEGLIGYLDEREVSRLSVYAFDPNNRPIEYSLEENDLPSGLSLNSETGKIEGICKSLMNMLWHFTVKATIKGTDYSSLRAFSIYTNNIKKEYVINWEEEKLLDGKIGYHYNHKLNAKCDIAISYSLKSGSLPKGLTLNKNGVINGVINEQEKTSYEFVIRVENEYTYVDKELSIKVKSGYNSNAVDTFLYINKENNEEYQSLLSNFMPKSKYGSDDIQYKIDSSPKINVATLNTFDKVLLSYQFEQNFDTTIDIVWGKTESKKYFEDNEYKYDVYYKNFNEIHDKGETIEVFEHTDNETSMTAYNRDFRPGYIRTKTYPNLSNTKVYDYVITGLEYYVDEEGIKYYIQRIDNTYMYNEETLEVIEPREVKYIKIDNEKEIIFVERDGNDLPLKYIEDKLYAKVVERDGIKRLYLIDNDIIVEKDEDINNYYRITSPKYEVKTTSINGIRNIFKKKINVEKYSSVKPIYYKYGTQEILSGDFDIIENIFYDAQNGVYKTDISEKTGLFILYIQDKLSGKLQPVYTEVNGETQPVYIARPISTEIGFKGYIVYPRDSEIPFTNKIFRMKFDNDNLYYIEQNARGDYEFHRVVETNNIWLYKSSENEEYGYPKDIVLPYVTDDDVKDGVVTFFNEDDEEIYEWLESYKPLLPVFYSIPNGSLLSYSNVLKDEMSGKYWYERKFKFYELHFSYKFKNDIDNFTITFYKHMNDFEPEFQMI